MDASDLLREKPGRLFARYLIPALASSIFTSFYVITDTMMIGKGVGEHGLTALNILLPLYSVFMAIGYMFGVGGSVCMSVARGSRNDREANAVFTFSLISVLVLGSIFTLFTSIFLEYLVDMLGATEVNRGLALEYGRLMMGSAMLYFLSPFLQSFVKNDGDPKRAMVAAVTGTVWNIIWDYLLIFVFHMGMRGAILATIMGYSLNVLICATHFFSRRNQMRFCLADIPLRYLSRILQNGMASFFAEFTSAVVIFFFNLQILDYLGEQGLVIYSVITNLAIVVNSMMNGVSNTVQPLISYNFGAKKSERVHRFFRIGMGSTLLLAGILYLFILFETKWCILLFVNSADAIPSYGIPSVRIYFLGIFAQAIALSIANHFQAVMHAGGALLIGMLRGVLLPVILILIFPVLLGGSSIWFVLPAAEVLSGLAAIGLWLRSENREKVSV
ncbi:MAG: MATE family efflux transporter [Clostridiales bacterium]|nr:MATE family efflux transporter [Clostridiales bacterium]